ncbi:MAG: hypothetical protein JWN12_100 [Candidatus Saccharibacteria bacterium]|nr:hypothetical protein [Candidatus Saccharibacteria bacterium]
MKLFLRHFWFDLILTFLAITAILAFKGIFAAGIVIVVLIIEIAFSFDNAVINAKILARLSRFWQILFLTLGILIAVVGMRLVFPILLVALTANLHWTEVINIALNHPQTYAHHIEAAHPAISAFGGGFLIMLALCFFFNRNKTIHWLPVERHMQKIGHWTVPPIIAFALLGILAVLPMNHHGLETIELGSIGIGIYLTIQLLLWLVGKIAHIDTDRATKLTGLAALTSFFYLEILDASFSFDGVLGAFAITSDVILIAVGLGIGAFWVRSLTIFMVRHKTLDEFVFLEHGAHYAVAFLALSMLLSLLFSIPDYVTGLGTILIIGISFVASHRQKLTLI